MIKAENKRGVTTLTPEQQAALKRLSKNTSFRKVKFLPMHWIF